MKNRLFAILFIIANSVWAEPYALTDVLKLSLEKNREILIAEKGLERIKAQVLEAYASCYPNLSLKGYESYLKKTKETTGEPKLPPYTTSASLFLSQPIYTGGKIASAIRLAKVHLEIAGLSYQRLRQNVLYKVAEAYYVLIKAKRTREVFFEEEERAKTLLDMAKKRFSEGMVPELEVKRVRLNLKDTKTKLKKAEGDLEIATDSLKKAIGLLPDDKIEIVEELEYKPIDTDDAVSDALAHRLEIKEAEAELSVRELSAKIARAEYYPQVNLGLSYGLSGNKETFKEAINYVEEDYYRFNLELELPIFDGGRRKAKLKAERLSIDEKRLDLEKTKEVIAYEAREAKSRLNEAETRADLAKESLELAKENLEIMRLRYKEGVSSLIETLDVETSLSKASLDCVNSLIDCHILKTIFYKMTGRIEEIMM
jgi:outer membrane protein TolC